jgi:hypothetical protein
MSKKSIEFITKCEQFSALKLSKSGGRKPNMVDFNETLISNIGKYKKQGTWSAMAEMYNISRTTIANAYNNKKASPKVLAAFEDFFTPMPVQ